MNRMHPSNSGKLLFVFHIISLCVWLSFIVYAKTVFIPYLVVAIAAVFGLSKGREIVPGKKEKIVICMMALVLSFAVSLSNYNSFAVGILPETVKKVLYFAAGCSVFYNMLTMAYHIYEHIELLDGYAVDGKGRLLYFAVPFGIFTAVYLVYFFFGAYPGTLTRDSVVPIEQAISGTYSNHHPFYHTLLIKGFYTIGVGLFGSANAGVAVYCVFQILAMAAVFSFAVYTLYEIKVRRGVIAAVVCIFALLPYHIMFASTVWKDVIFGGACLLLVISFYRVRNAVGNKTCNAILFAVACLLVCLMRSNGLFAFAILAVVLAIVYRKKLRHIPAIAFCAIVVAVILTGPVLKAIGVTPGDTVESLSIPLQQIARTVSDGGTLNAEQSAYVESLMGGTEEISQAYLDYLSDPIKDLAREKGANAIIDADKIKFAKMWLSIGLDNLESYLHGWVDQTKGYWGGRWDYWVTTSGVYKNSFGAYFQEKNNFISEMATYLSNLMAYGGMVLPILAATALYTWLYLILAVFNIMKKRKGYLELVLGLAIILSLMVATPVFNEFRYAYGIYTMMPVVFIFALLRDRQEVQ